MKNLYSNPSFSGKAAKIFFIAFFTLVIARISVFAQQELVFRNSTLYSGTAGADGAIYKFPSVKTNVDALVKINGRSDVRVTLSAIDQSSSGYNNAFQPEVVYNNGSTSSAASWWMDFQITFVTAGTANPVAVNNFNVTALDIDGDNNHLHEWDAFYSSAPNAYTLESNTLLSVSNFTQVVNGVPTVVGKQFDGPNTLYVLGVDTSTTRIMTTLSYTSASVINFRAGATTTSSSSMTTRMYSTWFKNFTYSIPLVTLPVKLVSFNAMLNNNKVDLKWTTASEINVSHFVVERSFDGINFNDAAIVFAFGNTTQKMDYNYSDNISSVQSSVIYYRLRSVDIDGKFEYSEVRIIRISKQVENNITITAYPNPVTNQLNVTIPNNWQNKKVVFEIFNANGQVSKRSENNNGSQTETINVSNLAPGFYVVNVSCDGQKAQQKIIKK